MYYVSHIINKLCYDICTLILKTYHTISNYIRSKYIYVIHIVIDCIILKLNTNFNNMDHMLNEQASICHKSQDMSEKAF